MKMTARRAFDPKTGGTFTQYPATDGLGPMIYFSKDGYIAEAVGSEYQRAAKLFAARARAAANRKSKDEILRSMGLTKVRGALGGTYWE